MKLTTDLLIDNMKNKEVIELIDISKTCDVDDFYIDFMIFVVSCAFDRNSNKINKIEKISRENIDFLEIGDTIENIYNSLKHYERG